MPMSTIIQYTKTGNHYILLGAGYGQWASARPNRVLGDLFAHEQKGDQHILCVCDPDGKIYWVHPDDAFVVATDNQSPALALSGFQTGEVSGE